MNRLLDLIRELMARKFYGTLEIKFENGTVVHLRKIENIKP